MGIKKPVALSCLLAAAFSPEGIDVAEPNKALALLGTVPDLVLDPIIDGCVGSKSMVVLLPSSE